MEHSYQAHPMHKGHHPARQEAHHPRHKPEASSGHHGHIVADFQKRFCLSLVVTIPILFLSPVIQKFLGFEESLRFSVDSYLLFALSSGVFFYGGYPFLKGIVDELKKARPGMMT